MEGNGEYDQSDMYARSVKVRGGREIDVGEGKMYERKSLNE